MGPKYNYLAKCTFMYLLIFVSMERARVFLLLFIYLSVGKLYLRIRRTRTYVPIYSIIIMVRSLERVSVGICILCVIKTWS